MTIRRRPSLLAVVTVLGLAAVAGALVAESAAASVPASIQGTFTRNFSFSDFPHSEEPMGLYTMKITPSAVIWSAKGLGVSIEQAKPSGTLLFVRDKPGSLGRLCAQDGWGSYRYTVNRKTVTFVKVKDPCRQRGEVLAKTWRRQATRTLTRSAQTDNAAGQKSLLSRRIEWAGQVSNLRPWETTNQGYGNAVSDEQQADLSQRTPRVSGP
jgi:hypothetical protein